MIGKVILHAALLLVVAASIWFVTGFHETLHCSQETSFAIAAFDMVPNEEERPVPLVYAKGYAFPLRASMALGLVGLLFGPVAAAWARVAGRASNRTFWVTTSLCIALGACILVIPASVTGERFQALYAAGMLLLIGDVAVCAVALLASSCLVSKAASEPAADFAPLPPN